MTPCHADHTIHDDGESFISCTTEGGDPSCIVATRDDKIAKTNTESRENTLPGESLVLIHTGP